MGAALDSQHLAAVVASGDRRALARAITLVESSRAEDRAAAEALVAALLPRAGKALRLGISGTPGVGKSTFVEAFGLALVAAGHSVAVLAVDPTSPRGGGSILGDKTRMPELAKSERAFIRPSPSGKRLGGVTRHTREVIAVVEAAGFDRVIVETVGVGQAETEVADMVDLFILLLAPGGGDDLQGIKRGNLELADLVIVTKCDGELEAAAQRAVVDYRHALQLLRPHTPPKVMAVSALFGRHVDDAMAAVEDMGAALAAAGELTGRRARQAEAALKSELAESVLEALRDDTALARLLPELERKIAANALTPAAAAREALAAFLGRVGRR
jgi:LAO/AO transport system kinase